MTDTAAIIAATDFSLAADRATRRAASLASELSAELHLVHVTPPERFMELVFKDAVESQRESLREHSEKALDERAQFLTAAFNVKPNCVLLSGQAHRAILDAAADLKAGAVVLGALGEREHILPGRSVGDTAMKVAEHARAAVLLVRTIAETPYRRVLACAKGAPVDREVLRWAGRVSPAHVVHVVSACPVPYGRRLVEWGASQDTIATYARRGCEDRRRELSALLGELGVPKERTQLHVDTEDALQSVLRQAQHLDADLIVVGKREAPDALAGRPFGSIARHIALLAPMDVMIVHP